MRYIPQPRHDEVAIYDRLIKSHRDSELMDRLHVARFKVLGRYDEYEDAADVTQIAADPAFALFSDDLVQNYVALRTGSSKEIGLNVMSRSKVCCLCGHGDVSQLDHYLPKRLFPEFSALTANLVPVCARCNQKKGPTYLRPGSLPAFLHPYRDVLPDEQFLTAKIEIDSYGVTPFYDIAKASGMKASVFDTLVFQFDRLGIRDLYGFQATSVLDEKRPVIYAYYGDNGAAAVHTYLNREAVGARVAFGRNHWKPVLLEALANDQHFCDEGFKALGPPGDLG